MRYSYSTSRYRPAYLIHVNHNCFLYLRYLCMAYILWFTYVLLHEMGTCVCLTYNHRICSFWRIFCFVNAIWNVFKLQTDIPWGGPHPSWQITASELDLGKMAPISNPENDIFKLFSDVILFFPWNVAGIFLGVRRILFRYMPSIKWPWLCEMATILSRKNTIFSLFSFPIARYSTD